VGRRSSPPSSTESTMLKKLVALAALLLSTAALAEESRATPEDAQELVKTAIALTKRSGREKAFKEMQNKAGAFIYKDLYIIVIDMKAKILVQGAFPERVGMDAWNTKDVDGVLYMQDRVKIAQGKGSGWQEYKFKNPASGKIEGKRVYVEKFEDVIFACGAYKP
jgi:cytochrome c